MSFTPSLGDVGGYAMQVLGCSPTYPFVVSRVLVQCGYEPEPARSVPLYLGLLGDRPGRAWKMAGPLTVLKHVKHSAGWRGLWCGFQAKGAELMAYLTVKDATRKGMKSALGWKDFPQDLYPAQQRPTRSDLCRDIVLSTVSRCVAVGVSHPFDVVGTRTIGQLLGGETTYNNVVSSLIIVGREQSLQVGLYAGFLPALLAEAIQAIAFCVAKHILWWIAPLPAHAVAAQKNCHNIVDDALTGAARSFGGEIEAGDLHDGDEDMDLASVSELMHQVMPIVISQQVYPFMLVKTRMIMCSSGLVAGSAHYMPAYKNWQECWTDLYAVGGWTIMGLWRGSSFRRTLATRPTGITITPQLPYK